MKIKAGKPKKSGWYFNVIPEEPIFVSNVLVILWTDYFDKESGTWGIIDLERNEDIFWAELPEVVTSDGKPFLKVEEGKAQTITLNDGLPQNPGGYILALAPEKGLPWYFNAFDTKIELPPNMKGVLQSDRFQFFGDRALEPNSCQDTEDVIGWAELPELIFPDGTIIK